MKICHVAINNIFLPPYEGGGVHEFTIAKKLSLLGNEVHMFIDRKDREEPKTEMMEGIEVNRLDVYRLKRRLFGGSKSSSGGGDDQKRSGFTQNMKRTGVKILGVFLGLAAVPFIVKKARKCDIIYERASSFGAGTFTSMILRKPLVVEVVDLQRSGFLLKRANGIVAHFDGLVPEYIDREKMLVIENAVDIDVFNPDIDGKEIRKFYRTGKNKIITYTGGFHPWHALDKMVASVRNVAKRFPDFVFMMIGDGPEKERIIKMVKDYKLDKNFIFTGKISHAEIPEFLAASDILVVLYTDSAYLNVQVTTKLCEYMAMGKPVIVYGIKEGVVKHGENGMIIRRSENIEEKLGEYLIELVKDKKLREKIGKKAYETVKGITWEDKAKLTNDLFEKLVS